MPKLLSSLMQAVLPTCINKASETSEASEKHQTILNHCGPNFIDTKVNINNFVIYYRKGRYENIY